MPMKVKAPAHARLAAQDYEWREWASPDEAEWSLTGIDAPPPALNCSAKVIGPNVEVWFSHGEGETFECTTVQIPVPSMSIGSAMAYAESLVARVLDGDDLEEENPNARH